MELMDKLQILTDSAKYDVACTSSGVDRGPKPDMLGTTAIAGICHSFSSDGRCIALLKVLMSIAASMTASTASTAVQTTCRAPALRRRSWPH